MPAGIDLLLAVAEAGAEDAGDALVPGQLHEGLGIGNADQLGGLGAIADVVPVAVDEEIRGRAIDQLEAASPRRVSQWSAGTPLPTMRPVTETNW